MFHKDKIGQAIILCGGFGKRLSEITNNSINKSVVKIGGKPFIYYILGQLHSIGIKRIVYVLAFIHHQLKKQLKYLKAIIQMFLSLFSRRSAFRNCWRNT